MENNDIYLLTGATGQLGPMVLGALIEQGVSPDCIHLLVRSHEKAKKVFDTHNLPEMHTITWNMTDSVGDLKRKIPPEITHFVNMAGSVKFAESAKQEVVAVNLRGAITLAQLALAQWKLTHVSTAYILGRLDTELAEDFINEDTEREPKNPYEAAKWDAEIAIGNIFRGHEDRLQIVRPSILTDAVSRPDLWGELHAAMGYYAPFIMLRKILAEKWEAEWVDLEWFAFAGNYNNPINIIDNTVAGDIIGRAIINHQSRAMNVVNSTPPLYGELTNYVLQALKFTGYSINGETVSNNELSTKISQVEKWDVLKKVLKRGYDKNSIPNYYPYATHDSRFAGGVEIDNEKLAKSAVQALIQ